MKELSESVLISKAQLYDESLFDSISLPEVYEQYDDLLEYENVVLSRQNDDKVRKFPDSALAETGNLPPAGNTGGVSRILGGFDGGCEVGYDGKWDSRQFSELCERLDFARSASDFLDDERSYIRLCDKIFKVSDRGATFGAIKYKYVLIHHGLKVYIHSNPVSNIQPIRVFFGFHVLCKSSLFACNSYLCRFFSFLGFEVRGEILSRVDCQVLFERSLSDYVSSMSKFSENDCIVTQCRGKLNRYVNLRSRKTETITLSSESLELCIYDKRSQILSQDKETYELFRRYVLGGGELPSDLTRIEFRFRRDILRRYGINTFDDLRVSVRSLLSIVSYDWFRILLKPKTRNSDKQSIDPLWQEVRDRFDYYFSLENQELIERSREALKNFIPQKDFRRISNLVRQAGGCLATVAAFSVGRLESSDDMLDFSVHKLREVLKNMFDKYRKGRIENEVLKGFSPCDDFSDDVMNCIDVDVIRSNLESYVKSISKIPF
ncbi:MAG: hypothetical protein LBC74_02170 [Planctomycetaceae bacterium]|jgi:hypothetical protein|nr:hypothetical protein [Planctomycetaceae bacterium]